MIIENDLKPSSYSTVVGSYIVRICSSSIKPLYPRQIICIVRLYSGFTQCGLTLIWILFCTVQGPTVGSY